MNSQIRQECICLPPMSVDKVYGNILVSFSESGNFHIASSVEKRSKECLSIPYLQFLKERYKCQHHEITDRFCKMDKKGIIREYQLEKGTVVVNLYN